MERMTQEERNLLIQDLCARLPYGVIVKKEYTFVFTNGTISKSKEIEKLDLEDIEYLISGDDCVDVLKPYLRTMSSMTEEEQNEFVKFHCTTLCPIVMDSALTVENESSMIDWLNEKMFDFRGLIKKRLAIKVTPENNPYDILI